MFLFLYFFVSSHRKMNDGSPNTDALNIEELETGKFAFPKSIMKLNAKLKFKFCFYNNFFLFTNKPDLSLKERPVVARRKRCITKISNGKRKASLHEWCRKQTIPSIRSRGRPCILGREIEEKLKFWILEAAKTSEHK